MFDWRDYLDLANGLSDPIGTIASMQLTEASHRSAVSRAYFAAFCHARNHAVQHLGYVARHAVSDHGRLRHHFRRLGMIDVAERLDDLRAWRNEVDYNDIVPNMPSTLSDALRESAAVIHRL
jgi:hypothetical protein